MEQQIFSEEGKHINKILPIQLETFYVPTITYDSFSDNDVEPDIKVIEPGQDLYFLESAGICLYSFQIQKKDAWAKRQNYIVYLRHDDVSPESASKKLTRLPNNHYLEVDIANKKMRLVGPFISQDSNKSQWLDY